MAIALGGSGGQGAWATGQSSMSGSLACTGNDRCLLIGVATYSGSLVTVSSITHATVALTKIASISSNLSSNWQSTELWYLDAPSTAASQVVVTLSGTATYANWEGAFYTGKTVAGIDSYHTAQDLVGATASPTNNVDVVHSDCWLVGWAAGRAASTLTAGAGTTLRRTPNNISQGFGDSNGVVSAGANSLHFNQGSATYWQGVVSAAISAANASAGTFGARPYYDMIGA